MLVERDRLLAVLTTLVEQAAAGCGSLIFLGGEAGVGKTSLAVALADEADELLAVLTPEETACAAGLTAVSYRSRATHSSDQGYGEPNVQQHERRIGSLQAG